MSLKPPRAFGEDNPCFEFQALGLHHLDPDVLAAVLEGPERMLEGYVAELILPLITCPVLQADPRAGGLLSDAEVEVALRLLPRASHVRLQGIGPPLHGRHPHEVLEAITPLVSSLGLA